MIAKKNLLLNYGSVILVSLLVLALARLVPSTELTLTFIFLAVVLIPGFLLAKLFNFSFNDDFAGNVVLSITFGFLFIFVLNLLAIILKLSIYQLIWLYLSLSTGCFLLAIAYNWQKDNEKFWWGKSALKKFFKIRPALLYPLILFVIVNLFLVLTDKAAYGGDAFFHLSVIRKAFDGQPLSLSNLNYIFDPTTIHVAYGVPVWHIFIAFLAQIAKTNIFNVWGQIALPMSIFSILVFYWLAKLILPTKWLAYLAIFCFLISRFGYGSGLTTLFSLPEYLGELFFLPLLLALTVKFIFMQEYHGVKTINWKLLSLLALFSFFVGMIHWIQYFYFLSIIAGFIIIYAVFGPKTNKKEILKKACLAFFCSWPFVLSYIGFLKFKGVFSISISKINFIEPSSFQFSLFKYQWIYFYFILMTGMSYFISRRFPKFFLLTSAFLIPVLLINNSLRALMSKFFNHSFWVRIDSNLNFDFLVWPLLIGLVFFGANYYLYERHGKQKFRLKNALDWLSEPNISPLHLYLFLLLAFFTLLPAFGQLKKQTIFEASKRFVLSKDYTASAVDFGRLGGQSAVNFIRKQPPKSVVLASPETINDLMMLVDMHACSYPDVAEMGECQKVYADLPIEEKKAILKLAAVNYVFVSPGQEVRGIEEHPEVFQKIFDSETKIYKTKLD